MKKILDLPLNPFALFPNALEIKLIGVAVSLKKLTKTEAKAALKSAGYPMRKGYVDFVLKRFDFHCQRRKSRIERDMRSHGIKPDSKSFSILRARRPPGLSST